MVDFSEETADLVPAGPLAGLAGFADQHDEKVEAMAGGIDHAVGSAADQVAEDGEKLEENGGRVGLGVRSDGADGESRETVKGGFAQLRSHRWPGRGC